MATTVSLNQLLSAPQITRVISTLKQPQSRLQQFLGMQPNGPNVNPIGGHFAGFDQFNKTRRIAKGRPPGLGPGTLAPQIIGHVPITLYRAHEKMPLLEERVFRTRPLGNNFGNVDLRGQRYVTEQERYLAQGFVNSREFMISRMLRGSFQLLSSGDDWIPVDSGGMVTINYNIPTGNTAQLNVTDPTSGSSIYGGNIIDVKWTNTASDVVNHFLKLNAAAERQHGRSIAHCWCSGVILNALLSNTRLINLGGTANTVFKEFEKTPFRGPDGYPDTGFEVVFRGLPWMTFHSYDAGLDVNGTFAKFFDDTHVVIMPEPDSTWMEYYEGSEIVAENVMSPGAERFGLYGWSERTTQPAGWELIAVDNGLPVLYVPYALYYATVDF